LTRKESRNIQKCAPHVIQLECRISSEISELREKQALELFTAGAVNLCVPKYCTFQLLITQDVFKSLGPTQPPIQWVPGPLYLVVNRAESEADYSPPSSAEVKE